MAISANAAIWAISTALATATASDVERRLSTFQDAFNKTKYYTYKTNLIFLHFKSRVDPLT